jgi:deoxyribodipyrimidine photo-lyase
MLAPTSFVWMRRDLRLHDHASLHAALNAPHAVQPIFIFDSDILKRFSNPKDRRLTFLMKTCMEIHASLQKRGGGLIIGHGKPQEIWKKIASISTGSSVHLSEDYEPHTQQRDHEVEALLKGSLSVHRHKDHVIMSPHEVLKDDRSPYKVFTPYSRRWREKLAPVSTAEYGIQDRGRYQDVQAIANSLRTAGITVLDPTRSLQELLAEIGYQTADISLWPVDAGPLRLQEFSAHAISSYKQRRDLVGIHGTSRLSPYLRFGLVSVRECMRLALAAPNSECWVNELIWREFYHMILAHFPHTPQLEFNPVYQGTIEWSQDETLFKAFVQGMSGYPIVDAAMRELLQTGWMHNRARMIVASFMTKDLLLDWRLGEEHFAQHLMDYELSSNVGGWQWAASTGTDAQPYFRIFNPVLQSKKFDPEGDYIRTYVPELSRLSNKEIHEPWLKARPANYPLPIVEHSVMRDKALAMFKNAERKRVA